MDLRPNYPITTARLRLRPPEVADVPAMLAYRSDPQVCRYLPFTPMDDATLRARLAGDMGRREITGEDQSLTLVVETTGGSLIGDVVVFTGPSPHRGGEIGYVFHPSVAGQGYATEACAALLDLAFDPLGLRRVVARMDARNLASTRLAARLGMRCEAHLVEHELFKGQWSDLLVYAVLEREWTAARH